MESSPEFSELSSYSNKKTISKGMIQTLYMLNGVTTYYYFGRDLLP